MQVFIYLEDFDLTGIRETYKNTSSCDFLAESSGRGCHICCLDRPHSQGSGMLICVNPHPRVLSASNISNTSATCVQLNNESGQIKGLVIRSSVQPPDTDEKVYPQIAHICCENDCVIIGDFNIPITKWGEPLTAHLGQQFYKDPLESSLHQHAMHQRQGAIFQVM